MMIGSLLKWMKMRPQSMKSNIGEMIREDLSRNDENGDFCKNIF